MLELVKLVILAHQMFVLNVNNLSHFSQKILVNVTCVKIINVVSVTLLIHVFYADKEVS